MVSQQQKVHKPAHDLAPLLEKALSTFIAEYGIWRAVRDEEGHIIDFELLHHNHWDHVDVENNHGVNRTLRNVLPDHEIDRMRNILEKALNHFNHNGLELSPDGPPGFANGHENTVIPLTCDEVLVIYHDGKRKNDKAHEMQLVVEDDSLTDLINQVLIKQSISEAMLNLQKFEEPFVFGYLNIDDFGRLNDDYGYPFGNAVLTRFKESMEEFLGEKDHLIRLSGDEFAVIVHDIRGLSGLSAYSKKLLEVAGRGFDIDGIHVGLSFSAGYVLVIHPQVSEDEVYQLANSQMYKAKNQGKNGAILAVLHGPRANGNSH